MGGLDFPGWFAAGSYGGLAFSVLMTAGVAAFALGLHRGTPRQLARATLVCLVCCCCLFASIWWFQTRFDLLGPVLQPAEVAFWLAWTALLGWGIPLIIAVGYLLLARPQPATAAVAAAFGAQALGRATPVPIHLTRPDDPSRLVEALGSGRPWGQLVPLAGPYAERPVPLTRQVILLGREANCDIVLADDEASRHHAELRWDHGRFHLVDRGSLNGTRVNGQGILGQVLLRSGDIVEIGTTGYRFEAIAQPASTSGQETEWSSRDLEATRRLPGAPRSAASSPHAAPALTLVAETGPQPGMRWPLGALVTVGRDASCAVILADSSVSRQHAQIVRQPNGYYVHDLNSQNGTLVNGQPLLAPTLLRAGDMLQVGEVVLGCERAAQADTAVTDAAIRVDAESAPDVEAFAASSSPNTHILLNPPPGRGNQPHIVPPRLIPSRPRHLDH
jgi:pSer/pThr/pTyr-binding forkhead associated (FHA) protein